MTPSQTSEEGRKEFNRNYTDYIVDNDKYDKYNEIKSHILSREIAQLEAVKEWAEKEKKEVPYRPLIQKGGEFERRDNLKYQEKCMIYMAQSSYNRSLQNLATFIDSEISKIKGQK